MTHILYVTNENIVEVLNEVEQFIERMNKFIEKNNDYKYDVYIKKLNTKPTKWESELKIYKKDVEVS